MPPEDKEEDQVENQIQETFDRNSTFAKYNFLFEFWQAWMINATKRHVLPICRIIIGDEDDGSVLLDKPVMITGLLHLAYDLTKAAGFNISRVSELPGFVMDLPGGESHVVELIEALENELKEIRRIVEGNKLFAAVEDDKEREQ